jgi:AraC-like DNA-binding protein
MFYKKMAISESYLCGLAAAVYVTTCIVVAAVRWFHMCRPYNRNPRYYYPGRPFVTAAWLSSLCLIPYVLNPESTDAWLLARMYFLPVTLYHFVIILFSYFGSVMQWKKWLSPVIIAGTPVVLALLFTLVVAIIPGEQASLHSVTTFLLQILGLLITAVCFTAIAIVWVWASRFDPDDFSNPADFPVTQARRWLVMVLLNTALCWTGALMGSPAVLAEIQILISFSCVLFVITALHPNRSREVAEPSQESPEQVRQHRIPRKKQEEILSAVKTVVESQEAFLDPHLTLQDVADRSGYSRTYISGLVKSELGGFVNYVNRLRLAYVDSYLKDNPDATLGEAIDAAGFGSRPTYYSMKSKMEQ